ncbi:MAG: bifunctional tRNA (5-methylaminomethyl-2-thiouridine)(34)-methyltransferase MnmD/FAD-dependent 5-carboxymethylaminomethyl-2-thiouridine(34) oxidoreductase MnmC [Zoogloea sp.]|nr:bifunctional tRNA (5-methylaminomethyl-2-thiouridine)(34)-methyltransferase MnmD/FAD-dependent 5-carboxymethylaminomethyl-2-thiouridine(34) oxidoreductase MnmC [Zoogloea sp.]
MYSPIIPARLEFSADGTPYSSSYGDVYHSADGGQGQARHVFLGGNGLPERWRGRDVFTVVETGFGLGLNFLVTWAAWRADPQRSRRLHFVSFEKHPFSARNLAQLHAAWPELAALAAELRAQWPLPLPGFHRLHLDDEQVCLTLVLGDALEQLPQLVAQADAFYLDGFSPAKNPELWSPPVFAQLARLAAPGATLATWSVNGAVRRALEEAGFALEKQPGFGGKREMLCGRYTLATPAAPARPERHALVIGAGAAGSSIAERLAARGWRIDLIEQHTAAGASASGNRAGAFRPQPSLDDNFLAQITRAGFLYGRRHLAGLAAAGYPVRNGPTGVLHLARDQKQAEKHRAVVDTQQPPTEYLRYVEADEASEICGWPVEQGGWWFPWGGWIQPPSLCAANIARHGERVRAHFGTPLAKLVREGELWLAQDGDGRTIASAPVAILANGVGIRALPQAGDMPVVSARGQVSHLPASTSAAPRVVVCRTGYITPEVDGIRCAGATFDVEDEDTALRVEDTRENLTKLEFVLPGYTEGMDPAQLDGRVGFRPASPDRLPMVGAIPAREGIVTRETPLAALVRQPGLYAVSGFGARGLAWASLMAELLASQLEGEPLPLPATLVAAVDPGRYRIRPPGPPRKSE